ncbi:MAG: peroxidase family protein [Actinomycetes bacterium]
MPTMTRAAKRWLGLATSTTVAMAGLAGIASPALAVANSSELVVSSTDLAFILHQIQVAETHASREGAGLGLVVPATSVLGSGPNDVPTTATPWGLRQVDGRNNNLGGGGANKGAADMPFPRLTAPQWRPGYGTNVPVNAAGFATANGGGPSNNPPSGAVQFFEDRSPRMISNLIVDQTPHDPSNPAAMFNPAAETVAGSSKPVAGSGGIGFGSVEIPNVAPAGGIAPPYNSMFTYFGQFFDHGLDLVGKSATSFVTITPNDPADPLSGKGPMFLSRGTYPVGSNVQTTAGTNHTTPWIDQNQTYGSTASKQVLLRDYKLDANGKPVSTGLLLANATPGNIGTWADLKKQAQNVLGLQLVDTDITRVPLLLTDEYGRYLRGPNGFPQLVTNVLVNGTNAVIEGNPAAPVATSGVIPAGIPGAGLAYKAVPTEHAFLDDIAHNATPFSSSGAVLTPDADTTVGSIAVPPAKGTFDNELLDRHFITGDGRGNENIGLTTVHTIFHAEHNRLVGDIDVTLHDPANANLLAGFQAAGWGYGERLFQAARLVNENEYQHLVFETFVRRVDPSIHAFSSYAPNVNPDITTEFSQAVYRFGHSMLNETIPRDGLAPLSLFDGFLNPVEFNAGGLDGHQAAAAIGIGTSRQVGNEIDEFVTGALRNNLVGVPLDLAALNIARGRDMGIPSLNNTRLQLFRMTGNAALFPYDNWNRFADPANLRHQASYVNFLAAYGRWPAILAATTVAGKRQAANDLLASAADANAADHGDAVAFLSGTDATASGGHDWRRSYDSNGVPNTVGGLLDSPTGIDDIDLWVGGLAEARGAAAGMLGSTFAYIFRTQIENLQDGDRFYYIPRLAGTHLLVEIENNTLADMFVRNTPATGLPADMFSAPAVLVDLNSPANFPAGVSTLGDGTVKYTGSGHAVFTGRDVAGSVDRMAGGTGADTIRGFAGSDVMDGGPGSDNLQGGTGDDRIIDSGNSGVDLALGGSGDDYFSTGNGAGDTNSGGPGADTFSLGSDGSVVDGGSGNDLVLGGAGGDSASGQEGDDWIQGGTGADSFVGDAAMPPLGVDMLNPGNDVVIGGGGSDMIDGGGADDIAGLGDSDLTTYTPDMVTGGNGFDWATYTTGAYAPTGTTKPGADVDLALTARAAGSLRMQDMDVFPLDDVEAVSGGAGDDIIAGDGRTNFVSVTGSDGRLTPGGAAQVSGLAALLAPGVADGTSGNILLGGPGSDTIEGRGGNDLIDGDAALNVSLSHSCANPGTAALATIIGLIDNGTANGTCNASKVTITRQITTTPDAKDTVVYTGKASEYTITQAGGPGTPITVTDNVAGRNGTDVLRNIEFVKFGSAAPVAIGQPVSGQLPPAPAGIAVSPATGLTTGQLLVTITGSNLAGATQVSFGGTPSTPSFVSATTVRVLSPIHAAGPVDISVTTPSGTGSAAAAFTYVTPSPQQAAPTLATVTPPTGTAAGGQTVVLAGTGLQGVSAVWFGGVAATSFTVDSASQITAVTPSHVGAGAVAVAVSAPGGGASLTTGYTYTAAASAPTAPAVKPLTPVTPAAGTTPADSSSTTFISSDGLVIDSSGTSQSSGQSGSDSSSQVVTTTSKPHRGTVQQSSGPYVAAHPNGAKSSAPTIKVKPGAVIRLRVTGMPAHAKLSARVEISGNTVNLGDVVTKKKGKAKLPTFSLSVPGTYVVTVSGAGGDRYVKVVVK